jgi:hypothetical protein
MRSLARATIVVLTLFSSIKPAEAQSQQSGALEALLTPGLTIWIAEAGQPEVKAQVAGVSRDVLTLRNGASERAVRIRDVRRVRVRVSDPIWNGAVIGAGAAIATGLSLCVATEPWENCRDDVGPIARIGAVGAGIGIAIDALVRGRRSIYDAPVPAAEVQVVPVFLGQRTALHVVWRF